MGGLRLALQIRTKAFLNQERLSLPAMRQLQGSYLNVAVTRRNERAKSQ